MTTTVEPPEGGSIVMNPSSGQVLEGTSVTFSAQPKGDYVFAGWSGSVSGTENPKTVTVTSDLTVTANFILREYPLSISIEGEGSVSERVISTKTDYSSGTVVELTALPATGWSFDHWEGDLTGADNPISITISSAKTVKAVFTKNHYAYNLRIVGPGVVDEYLMETKGGWEHGTRILLKAIPSEGAVFKGWSGTVSCLEEEITIDVSETVDIVATFGASIHSYPLPNLYEPSVSLKRFYPEYFTDKVCTYAGNMMTCDYNRDGYPDLITSFTGDQPKAPIRFYLGDKDGNLTPDPINDSIIIGLDECRKIIYGEYNGDGIVDFCIISHGWDAEPFPGDYPLILLSNTDGSYRDVRFPDFVGYFHGGTAGDFDNDGDTDIFFSDSMNEDSVFLINDGKGNFVPNRAIVPNTEALFTAELYDIDKDGFLDLFVALPGRVIWGNGKWFSDNETTVFPVPRHGCDGYLDYLFYDLNNDGNDEILICSTRSNREWEIQVIGYNQGEFTDLTEAFFPNDDYYQEDDGVIIWLNIETVDDRVYLVGRMDGDERQTRLLFEFNNGIFNKCISDVYDKHEFRQGICIYSDRRGEYSPFIDLGYREEKYEGLTSMRFHNWPTWSGWSIDYSSWMDFAFLEKNDYCLEFAIKNIDPDLVIGFGFETRLQTEPWYFPSYGYTYFGSEHSCDGTWEIVRVPLSSMMCDPEWTGYYWNTIKTFTIMPGECHGKDFFVDEIRIRKVLPE